MTKKIPKIIFGVIHLILFISLFSTESFSQELLFEKSISKYALGNNLEWSSPDFNDDQWNVVYNDYIDYEANELWVRTKFYSNVSDYHFDTQQLAITLTATYEVYWNGNYIGNNSISNSDIKFRNGQFSKNFTLPDSLIFKENILALRMVVENGENIELAWVLIESRDGQPRRELYTYSFLLALVILHLIFLFFFVSNTFNFSQLQVVYFSVLLLSILFTIIYEVILFLGIISYHNDFIIRTIEFYQNNFLLLGITIFYFKEYQIKSSYQYIMVTALSIIVVNYFYNSNAYLYFVGLFPSIVLMAWSTIKKESAAFQALIFLLIIFSILYAWFSFSLNDISFIIFSSFFVIRKIRLDEIKLKELHNSKLKTARLETEMLKKILQPHYIMNSLNSVLEWIEESPKQGLKFINELSNEFRSFLTFSNKKYITIKDELNLCKNHLKVMEFRHHKKYSMNLNVKSLNQNIPPAILHTLVENGVTHNPTNSESICFIFDEQAIQRGISLRITASYKGDSNKLDFDTETKIKNEFLNSEKIIEGNGYRYIRSRLTESYGNNWELTYFGNDLVWVTNIIIYER